MMEDYERNTRLARCFEEFAKVGVAFCVPRYLGEAVEHAMVPVENSHPGLRQVRLNLCS